MPTGAEDSQGWGISERASHGLLRFGEAEWGLMR